MYRDFSRRLNRAMEEAGVPVRQRAKALKDWSGVESVESTRKWLQGITIPRRSNMIAICKQLGCSRQWLEDGAALGMEERSQPTALQELLLLVEGLYAEIGPEETLTLIQQLRQELITRSGLSTADVDSDTLTPGAHMKTHL